MVVGSELAMVGTGRIDRVFAALADSTRRDIVRLVLDTEYSVSALAQRYPMSFAAVHKHVAILERAGLVQKRRRGREQLVSGDLAALAVVNSVLDSYAEIWRHRVDQMNLIVADSNTSAPSRTSKTSRNATAADRPTAKQKQKQTSQDLQEER